MADMKIVIGTKDGKCVQKTLDEQQSEVLVKLKIGDKVSGDDIGLTGYEFLITGGSDKCGFPMRKGIQAARKRILIGEGVGFSGKDRFKDKQKGLVKRRTVCGEIVTKIINQVNLKVTKEGSTPLVEAPVEAPAEEKKE